MEKIDLTKCVNCRFRAKVDGKEVEGMFAVDGNYLRFFYNNGDIYSIHIPCYRKHGTEYFDDFEIVPRDPDTYRDWQVGDRVNISDTHTCWEELVEVIFRSGELVVCKDSENNATETKTCDQLYREGGRLVLTDIEQQIIEKKKKYEPQDGDIVAWKYKEDDMKPAISIYKEKDRGYATMYSTGDIAYSLYSTFAMNIIRPATDEEKQLLFDAMAKEGKRWNAEKKVVEDILQPYEFKKGEPVLVKDEGGKWRIGVFIQRENSFYGYRTRPADGIGEIGYPYCLPYNEKTMHLLGTTEDYKKE